MKQIMAKIRIAAVTLVLFSATHADAADIRWTHPAGFVTKPMIEEVRAKIDNHPWAAKVYARQRESIEPWLTLDAARLKEIFPTTRGNIYHNFTCPKDKTSLPFDPFQRDSFTCPACGTEYPPDVNAQIYPEGAAYHGTLLDGWESFFYVTAAPVARDLAIVGWLEDDAAAFDRAILLLDLFTGTIERLPRELTGPASRILTYHREGDNKVLNDLAIAYELVRHRLDDARRERYESIMLGRILDEVMLDPPVFDTDWNNVYQWHLTVLQTALALEREELIDWSFGFGDAADIPEHRHLQRILATHYKPDGAFWELCSGYHLYPVQHFTQVALLSHNLSLMDPARFPAERYDLTSPENPGSRVIHAALQWFLAIAMPDRTMTTIGDNSRARESMAAAGIYDGKKESMAGYRYTAEIGYRYYGLKAVGDYEHLVRGERTWEGLLVGAPTIERHELPFTSSNLSSGWVSLRSATPDNRIWVALNGLRAGGSHQHADRLELLMYSQEKLLALEKAVPYNDSAVRNVGVRSFSHNTVTIDGKTQPDLSRGNWKGIPPDDAYDTERLPVVRYFHDSPLVKFTEMRADKMYDNSSVYRRSVTVIEDIAIDRFDVRGGEVHDWIVNHAGTRPEFSMPMEPVRFEPVAWLLGGTTDSLGTRTDVTWDARWKVEEVTSRLTMLGSAGTELFSNETYPLENASVTKLDPAVQTVDVRRRGDAHAPFFAVWDAWKSEPNLVSVKPGDREGSLLLQTRGHRYHLLFGPGEATFEDGWRLVSDGAFAIIRDEVEAVLIGGSRLEVETPGGKLELTLEGTTGSAAEQDASLWAASSPEGVKTRVAGAVQYDTVAGEDRQRPEPEFTAEVGGTLWPSGRLAAKP